MTFRFHQSIHPSIPTMKECRALVLPVALSICVLGYANFSTAWAGDNVIQAIKYNPANQILTVDSTGRAEASVNTLSIGGNKRIILDIKNSEIGLDLPRDQMLLKELSSQWPAIRNISVNQFGGSQPVVRVLIDVIGADYNIELVKSKSKQLELKVIPPTPQVAATPVLTLQPTAVAETQTGIQPEVYQSALKTIEAQRQQLTQLQEEVSKLQQVKASAKSQAELQSLLDQQENELKKLRNQVVALSANQGPSLEEMRRTLAVMNQKYEQLSADNTRLQAQARQAQNAESLQNEIERLRESNRSLQDQLFKAYEERRQSQSAVSPELERLKADIAKLQNENSRLLNELSLAKKSSSKQAETALKQLQGEYEALTQQMEKLQQDNAQLKASLDKAVASAKPDAKPPEITDSQLSEMRAQLETAKQALGNSIKTINEQNRELAQLKNQMFKLQKGLDISGQEQIALLNQQLVEKDELIKQLRSQQGDSSRDLGEVRLDSPSEVTRLEKELAETKAQYQKLLESSKEKGGNSIALQLENSDLKKRLDASELKYQQAIRDFNYQKTPQAQQELRNKHQAEVQKLKEQLSEISSQHLKTQNKLKSTQQELATLKANAQQPKSPDPELTSKYQALENELAALQAEKKNWVEQSNSLLQTIQDENKALKAKISSLENTSSQLETLQKTNQQLEKQLADLVKEHNKLLAANAKKKSKEAESKNSDKEVASLRTELQAAQEKYKQATKELEDLRKEKNAVPIAISSMDRTVRQLSSPSEQYFKQAKELEKQDKLDEAIALYRKAVDADPGVADYVMALSTAWAGKKNYEHGINLLKQYTQAHPQEREALYHLGKLYLLNDQPELASQYFSQAIPLNVLNNYATSLKKTGKLVDAEQIFNLARIMNPQDSEVLFNLGNLYNSANNLQAAKTSYEEALRLNPDFAEAHYNLGLVYTKIGDKNAAVDHLETFLKLSPEAKNAEAIRSYVSKLKS